MNYLPHGDGEMVLDSAFSGTPSEEIDSPGLKQTLEAKIISAGEVNPNSPVLKEKHHTKLRTFQVDVLNVSVHDLTREQKRDDSLGK